MSRFSLPHPLPVPLPRAAVSGAGAQAGRRVAPRIPPFGNARGAEPTDSLEKFRDRRARKGEMRRLWIQRINAAAREHGMSYSEFMGKLNDSGIEINRKVLADLAMNDPKAFEAIVKKLK